MRTVRCIGCDRLQSTGQAREADRVLRFAAAVRGGDGACAGAHHWGRELTKLGHQVRLIPPAYVKPFVKRQSVADA